MWQFCIAALSAVALSVSGASFNVVKYGAIGDGQHYDTDAIRATFAACDAAGGGEVIFPAEKVFLTGSFNVSGNTVVTIAGTILGSPNSTHYVLVDPLPWYGNDPLSKSDDPREWSPLIQAWYVNNVTITGGGIINGNGGLWWGCASNASLPPCNGYIRPHGVRLVGVNGFHMYDISVWNSPMWQVHLAWVTGAWLHDMTVLAPASPTSHNTDGIDPDCSQDVLIERVHIDTGDDMIAIKSGRDWAGRTYGRPSANITVRDSTFGNGHGLSIGSEMSAGVYNVSFLNNVLVGSGTGLRMKSERGRGGYIKDIVYRNNTIINVTGQAFQVTLNYSPGIAPTNASGTPTLSNVLFQDITALNPTTGWFLDGLAESPLHGLTLNNVSIVNAKTLVQQCDNVDTSSCNDVQPSCPPCIAASPSFSARSAFTFVMPWMCLERCNDTADDIASEYWQLAVNTSTFTGVSFEDYNLGANSVLIKNNLTQMAGPLARLGLQRWAMVSSFPYPTEFLTWMRQVFANPQPFITAALGAAKAENLTGFNIDWEPTDGGGDPTPADAAAYVTFLDTFSAAMHGQGYLSSVCVATWSAIWDLPAIGASGVDFVMTMNTYTGRDDLFTGALDAVTAAIPLSKLVVGLETVNDDTGLPFNTTALELRFGAIKAAGVDKVAMWRAGIPDNWWQFLNA